MHFLFVQWINKQFADKQRNSKSFNKTNKPTLYAYESSTNTIKL